MNGFLSSVDIRYSIDASSFFLHDGFFGASTLALSSDILFCGALFAISGVEIFWRIRFCMDGSSAMDIWIHGAENLFGGSIFGSFGVFCFCSGLAVDIRNFDF